LEAFSEFDVIFIGTSPGNNDITVSNLRKIMGDILAGIILEHSGVKILHQMACESEEYHL